MQFINQFSKRLWIKCIRVRGASHCRPHSRVNLCHAAGPAVSARLSTLRAYATVLQYLYRWDVARP
jgi:hypothetical protein